jgi:hypothetical protein
MGSNANHMRFIKLAATGNENNGQKRQDGAGKGQRLPEQRGTIQNQQKRRGGGGHKRHDNVQTHESQMTRKFRRMGARILMHETCETG